MERVVGPGETVSGATVQSGDALTVRGSPGLGGQPANANATLVQGGGLVTVSYGALDQTKIEAGGNGTIGARGLATNTLLNGQLQLSDPTAQATNSNVADGGRILVNQGTVDQTVVGNGGTLVLPDSFGTKAVLNSTLNSGGTLRIESVSGAEARDTRLMPGGRIDLANLAYGGGVTATYNAATETLTVSGATATYNLDLAGTYTISSFILSSDGAGGTLIRNAPLCFCRGTRIATPAGERSVEDLHPGDLILTAGGKVRPIRWIGASAMIITDRNRPIIVRAGAIPGGAPVRDLHLTSGHALLFGTVLIPICALVNGISIIRDGAARAMQVYHIELDLHDILIADGAPAESYREDDNRRFFHEGRGDPGKSRTMPTCASVIAHGPIVERTRARLNAWARDHMPVRSGQSPTVRGRELVNSSIS